jgi:hypothetical protein
MPGAFEMTAVHQLPRDIVRHLDIPTSVTSEQLRDLMRNTDLRRLTDPMQELAELGAAMPSRATGVVVNESSKGP